MISQENISDAAPWAPRCSRGGGVTFRAWAPRANHPGDLWPRPLLGPDRGGTGHRDGAFLAHVLDRPAE